MVDTGDRAGTAVGLADAIAQVRAELAAARSAGLSDEMKFRIDEVTMQFAVDVAREGGAEASVKIWVVNVGAKGSLSSSRSNTVTVTMTPQAIGRSGAYEDVLVGDEVSNRPPILNAEH